MNLFLKLIYSNCHLIICHLRTFSNNESNNTLPTGEQCEIPCDLPCDLLAKAVNDSNLNADQMYTLY